MNRDSKAFAITTNQAELIARLLNDVDWLLRFTLPEQMELCQLRADILKHMAAVEIREIAWEARKAAEA